MKMKYDFQFDAEQIEVPDMTTKISTAVEHFRVVEIPKTMDQRRLFRAYQEHVDRLVCDALKNAIETRFVCYECDENHT